MAAARRYVILPTRGIVGIANTSADTLTVLLRMQTPGRASLSFAPAAAGVMPARMARPINVKVLASIHENGAKLVEMTEEQAMSLKIASPGLRIVPEVRFSLAQAPRMAATTGKAAFPKARLGTIRLKVVTSGGQPLPNVFVVAYTDWANGLGGEGTTGANGEVKLSLPASTKKLQRVFLYAAHTAWPMVRANVAIGGEPIALPLIDVAFQDARSKAHAPFDATDGHGVKVGVLDTGAGPHASLAIAKGASTVTDDTDNGFNDTDGHGTHVAGVIAARAAGFTGLAPSVELNAYRVFPRSGEGASNFDIAAALDMAVADGCDLVNLSIAGGPMDAVTDEAIKETRAKGVVCIIAAGNHSGPVENPGRHPLAVCVSAMGYKGAWPKGATQGADVTQPAGNSRSYIARFSNTGPEIDITGTGCGIISTYPQDRFAVMDGTSMACPCTTGALARLLAKTPQVLAATRDAARADQIVQLALTHARDLGFPPSKQGAGLCK